MSTRFDALVLASMGLLLGACANRDTQGQPTDTGWLARAQSEIAAREYRVSENGQGLQAPNRAHDLRTYFESTGIRVHDRTAGGSPELLALSLAGVGRGAVLAAPAAGAVATQENRVELRRTGLLEWYVNSQAGLEQGFTLSERPAGQGALVVELAVTGAHPTLLGDAVVFASNAGRRLRYGDLAATDAAHHAVAAHLELASDDRLRIVVDDAGAIYPVVIDPLLTETADTQLESDQANARLGQSVAGAGDVNGDGYADVIVGAPFYDNGQTDEGAAFVFLGSGSGIATGNPATAAALIESNQSSAFLGYSVAGAGDVNGDGYADVIVGALAYDNGQTDEGAAFVFLGSASGIANGNPATAAAVLESNQASAQLGTSVAGAGDVNGDGYADVIVGVPLYDNGETDEGAAFVFLGSASGIANGNPATAAAVIESNQAGGILGDLGFSVAG
ncbi:MAG TPA: integrin alpha, partial [Myxococcota bacterium]|nr:integrin alpha [Myxococcota bacterium]